MAEFVTIEKGLGPDGRIAVVRFDRGDGINALSPEALRRLTDVAGFTYRALEELTSSFKPAAGNPCFYGKSQWGRWLNGQPMTPTKVGSALARRTICCATVLA